jgi:Protein of unknown function (DUF1997)
MWLPRQCCTEALTAICTPADNTRLAAGQVQGHLDLEVWSEVIGPFRFMPRVFLESTGSAVLGALVRGLLPPFIGR